jgi:hypothetical protein
VEGSNPYVTLRAKREVILQGVSLNPIVIIVIYLEIVICILEFNTLKTFDFLLKYPMSNEKYNMVGWVSLDPQPTPTSPLIRQGQAPCLNDVNHDNNHQQKN